MALPPAVNYTFDTTAQSFTLNNYDNQTRKNLAGPNSPTTPTLMLDGAVGSPTPGSLALAVTFSDFTQYVDAALNLSSVDLTGKVLHAWVKLDAGLFAGGVQLHAGAGPNYVYAASEYTTFAALDTWIELTLNLSAAQTANSAFTPNDIRQLGVQFDTGDPSLKAAHSAGLPRRFFTSTRSRRSNRAVTLIGCCPIASQPRRVIHDLSCLLIGGCSWSMTTPRSTRCSSRCCATPESSRVD